MGAGRRTLSEHTYFGDFDAIEVALDLRNSTSGGDGSDVRHENGGDHHEAAIHANPSEKGNGERILFGESGW